MPNIRKPLFCRPADLGDVICSSADMGHPVANLGRFDAPGLTWKSGSSGTSHWVRGHFAETTDISFLAVLAANATADTQIRLRLSDELNDVETSPTYDSAAMDFISPTPTPEPASGLYHSHFELPSTEPANWWQIDITDHTGAFEAMAVVLGEAVTPSRFYNYDFEYGIEDLGSGKYTPLGVFDEDPGLIFRTLDFTMGWQTEAEFEASFRPFMEQLGTRSPILVCFDPEPGVYRQARTFFGPMKKPGYAKAIRKVATFNQEFSFLSMI